jgi:hypothetical protein
MESLSEPRLVSVTVRRPRISRSQLRSQQQAFRAERLGTPLKPAFVLALTVLERLLVADDRDSAIAMDLPTGKLLRIAATTPLALAAALLEALR